MNPCREKLNPAELARVVTLFPSRNVTLRNKTVLLPPDMAFHEGHAISIMAYAGLILVSAAANATVLRMLATRQHPSRLDRMLTHLAIADLLVTLIHMPLEIGWSATVSWWGGDTLCRFTAFFRTFGLYQSSCVLVCISIDRYLAVIKPLNFQNVDQRGKIMINCAWLTSAVCSLPQVVVFHEECHPQVFWYRQCIALNAFQSETEAFAYFLFGMMMMYVIPLGVIIFCYVSILLKICRKSRDTNCGNLRRSSLKSLSQAKTTTLKMTLTIVIVFIVCWTPYHIMALWYQMDKGSASNVDHRVQKVLFLFACTNSCMNPIVYGIYNLRSKKSKSNPNNTGLTRNKVHVSALHKTSSMSSRNTILSTAI